MKIIRNKNFMNTRLQVFFLIVVIRRILLNNSFFNPNSSFLAITDWFWDTNSSFSKSNDKNKLNFFKK
jgi:hypothetical protein